MVAKGEVERRTTQVELGFTVPEASYGSNYVQFRRAWRPEEAYGFMFTVLPDLQVSPSSATPGSQVTIKGTGFPGEGVAALSLDGKALDLEPETNTLGSFTIEFTVPDAIAGRHAFEATAEDMYRKEATASLEVVPGISLQPVLPDIGSEATVTGCGFAATSPVTVEYDDQAMAATSPVTVEDDDQAVVDSPQTDELGNFTITFTVPETSEAEHEITVTDGAGNVATLSLSLEGQPPLAPTTVSPQEQRFGWFGAQIVAFTWTDVSDPSGVTYTLEIGDNLNFFPLAPGMRKTELAQPTCLIELEPGTYYWRVKAVDGAGNQGEWTLSPYPFKVGFFSVWYLVLGGLFFLVVFVFIVRAFFRRVGDYF